MTKTVTNPAAMNAAVATIERGESRESPQTPCPLVQPEPYRVPIPTSKPAVISVDVAASICTVGSGMNIANAKGAITMPSTNAIRQLTSPRAGLNSPPRMPLMPAILPFSRTSSAADAPISTPPPSDAQGVKWSQSMVVVSFLF